MKWEYLKAQYLIYREVDEQLMNEELQIRGKESWELVSVLEKTVTAPDKLREGQQFTLFFKRQQAR